MTRCSCCERRIGHSFDRCECAADYCPRCLLCHAHCQCEPVTKTFPSLVSTRGSTFLEPGSAGQEGRKKIVPYPVQNPLRSVQNGAKLYQVAAFFRWHIPRGLTGISGVFA